MSKKELIFTNWMCKLALNDLNNLFNIVFWLNRYQTLFEVVSDDHNQVILFDAENVSKHLNNMKEFYFAYTKYKLVVMR